MSDQINISPENLMDFLRTVDDPRIDRTKKHDLIDILVVAICAAICGAKNWVEIEDFGNAKIDWFSSFLDLKHGIPSHDTFRRVFILLNPKKFQSIFINWVKVITKDKDLKQICIDGKTLRGSYSKAKASSAIHMVNAWSTGASLSLGQMKSEGKKCEIKTVPKLLDLLDVKGHIVTADAMNCQFRVVNKIIEKEGDYLLCLKGNQRYLQGRVIKEFQDSPGKSNKKYLKQTYKTEDDKHGRIEKRSCTVFTAREDGSLNVNTLNRWSSLNSIVEIKSERFEKTSKKKSSETRYYISSLKTSAKDNV